MERNRNGENVIPPDYYNFLLGDEKINADFTYYYMPVF
jgi:hypothetical protein